MKPTFVFLGGSEILPSAWNAVRAHLSRLRLESEVLDWQAFLDPQKPGILVKRLAESLKGVPAPILVGHSISGLILSALANRVNAEREIHIASLVAKPGLSFTEQMFEERLEIYDPVWASLYDRQDAISRDSVRERLLAGCPPGSARHLRDVSPNLMWLYERVFSEERHPRPTSYLACMQDRTIRPSWQLHAAGDLLHVSPTKLECGHLPMLSHPELLAEKVMALSFRSAPETRYMMRSSSDAPR